MGRLQAQFDLMTRDPDLVTMRKEIAWFKAKVIDDIQYFSKYNASAAALDNLILNIRARASSLRSYFPNDEVPEEVADAIKLERDAAAKFLDNIAVLLTDTSGARKAEKEVLVSLEKLSQVVDRESRRARAVEAVPTKQEWESAQRMFLQSFMNALNAQSFLTADQVKIIWESTRHNMAMASIATPQDMAVMRAAKTLRGLD